MTNFFFLSEAGPIVARPVRCCLLALLLALPAAAAARPGPPQRPAPGTHQPSHRPATVLTLTSTPPAIVPASNAVPLRGVFIPTAGRPRPGTLIISSAPGDYTVNLTVNGQTATPVISSLLPGSGAVGEVITISGTDLDGATSVSFNGTTQATITNNTSTSLTVMVPPGATTGSVTVPTPGGTSNGLPFTVTLPGPVITSFLPASGPIGSSVTITGSGFNTTAAQNVVFFGATRAAVTAASPTSLTVTVPLGATYHDLSVTNLALGLTACSSKPFDVTLVGAMTFQPKVDAATGTTPLTVATGDVTGDGKADVVTVNYDDNTVSVLRNTSTPGAVSFAPKVDYSTGQFPTAVAIGDLDGDGLPDLAVTNTGSAFVSVLRNTSTAGAVGFATSVDVGINTRAGSLAIGDVDRDGKPDLIVADFGNSLVLVLRNTSTPGAVSFAPPVSFVTGTDSYGAFAVALGDVDGDGLPDLAVTNYSVNTVSVFRNTSTPGAVSFAAKVDLGYGTGPYSVVLGDLDSDGLPDLTMTSGTSVAVFRNTSVAGTVSFAAGVDFTTGQRPYAVSMGDVDGDGLPDLAAAVWGMNSVWVLRNTSVPGTISLVAQAIVPTGTRPRSVAIGDMDGDGKPDLTTGNENSSTVSVLRQQLRVTGLFLSQGILSPAFDTETLHYTASVGNAISSSMVVGSTANLAAIFTVNGAAVVNGTYSDPIALAVGSNLITVLLDGVSYTLTVTRAAAPTLISLSPTVGPVGTSVTLTGSDLTGAVEVDFTGAAGITTGLTVSGSGSSQTITVTVPAGAVTGPVTVTTPNGTTNGVTFTVTYPDLVISTGTTAAPVAVAAVTYNSITVTGTGYAILDGAVVVNTAFSVSGSLDTNCQPLSGAASFTLAAGATLYICDANGISPSGPGGVVQTTGLRSFSTDASYVYNGTQVQITGTGLPATVRNLTQAGSSTLFLVLPVAIRQVLALPTTSNFNLNNHALTLLSDATGTALVANTGGGQVLGSTATLQRHIETNPASGGYRHYASPMQAGAGAETLATLATAGYAPSFSGAAAYNSSATPGLVTPFPTVFLYNQDRIAGTVSTYDAFSKGWQAALGSEVPQVGRGYSVQAPGAALVDFTGTLTSGSVSRSNLAWDGPDGGWHLLGNPFPSPLDWSTMTVGPTATANLQDMNGAVYVFQSSGPYAGSYRTYLAAAPGSSSPLIPAGSGFFVHTAAQGGAGIVRFTAANRVTAFGAQPAFGRSTDLRPLLTLRLAAPDGATDEALLYAEPAATVTVDAAYDAPKLANPSGLNLASLTGGEALAIDGRPALAGRIPLRVAVPATGGYSITAASSNLPAGTAVQLLDVLTGQTTDLRTSPTYAFTATAAAPATGRFFLNLMPAGTPLATAAPLGSSLQLYPNPAHSGVTVAGLTAGASVTVLDALGRTVARTTADAKGTASLALPAGLAAGVYVVRTGSQALRLTVE